MYWDDIKELSGIFIGVFIVIVVIMMIGFLPFYFIQKYSCKRFSDDVGKETRFELWGGGEYSCLVNINGEFIPRENWINNSGK